VNGWLLRVGNPGWRNTGAVSLSPNGALKGAENRAAPQENKAAPQEIKQISSRILCVGIGHSLIFIDLYVFVVGVRGCSLSFADFQ
jgi:hypothetical protein